MTEEDKWETIKEICCLTLKFPKPIKKPQQ